jgi:hypothetical protein
MNSIEEVVGKDFAFRGHGRYLKAVEHDSLVLDLEKQIFYWNSKGIVGNAFDWLTKVKGMSPADAKNYLGDFTPTLYTAMPDEGPICINEGLIEIFFELGKQYRDYWRDERGFTDSTIDMFKLGYTGKWYVVPIFVDGKFRNFQCRTPDKMIKSWYRGQGPLPFNLDYCEKQKLCFITEGPLDAIACMQMGIPAMASNSGAEHFESEWIAKLWRVRKIYIIFDNDAAGKRGAQRIAKIMGNKAKVFCFDNFDAGFDPNDYLKIGGSGIGLLELAEKESKYWWEISNDKG